MIEIQGHHFHNLLPNSTPVPGMVEGRVFLLNTFCHDLQTGQVELPDGENGITKLVPISSLGIGYPVIIESSRLDAFDYSPIPVDAAAAEAMSSMRPGSAARPGPSGVLGMRPEPQRLRKFGSCDDAISSCSFVGYQSRAPTRQAEHVAKQGEAAPTTAMQNQP